MSAARTHNTARLPLRLPADLLADLRLHADEQGQTLSDLCRRALRAQIQRDRLDRRLHAAREAFRDQVFIETKDQE